MVPLVPCVGRFGGPGVCPRCDDNPTARKTGVGSLYAFGRRSPLRQTRSQSSSSGVRASNGRRLQVRASCECSNCRGRVRDLLQCEVWTMTTEQGAYCPNLTPRSRPLKSSMGVGRVCTAHPGSGHLTRPCDMPARGCQPHKGRGKTRSHSQAVHPRVLTSTLGGDCHVTR